MTNDMTTMKIHNIKSHLLRSLLVVVMMVCALYPMKSYGQEVVPCDTVGNDFVIASLLLADPGDVLYSTVGHVAIRLQCPMHNLDYVFTYEAEDVSQKFLSFLAGKLKMGMFAIPTGKFLSGFAEQNRGVEEYTLNLPLEVKRNLWRVCDERVAEGANLPYDYLTRGCAYGAFEMIRSSLGSYTISFGSWPDYLLTKDRREIVYGHMRNAPWTRTLLLLICNGSSTDDVPVVEKVVAPTDLILVLKNAEINGCRIISMAPVKLLPSGYSSKAHWCSPNVVSIAVLVLVILGLLFKCYYMDYVLLSIQTAIGLITLYFVLFSSLVGTESSPLLIPYSILPLLFWKWRKYWCLPYAVIIIIWIICALLWPHMLTDTFYIILALSIAVSYVGIYFRKS